MALQVADETQMPSGRQSHCPEHRITGCDEHHDGQGCRRPGVGDAKDPEQLSSQEEANWRRPHMHVWSVGAYMHAFVRVCVRVYTGRVCVCT